MGVRSGRGLRTLRVDKEIHEADEGGIRIMAIKDIKMTETCRNCMHTELIKEITKILALHKLGRYTMYEAFTMIVDLVEEGYR